MARRHGDLSDAQAQQVKRDMQKRRARQYEDDLAMLMGQPWGRRLVYRMLFEVGGLTKPSFDGGIKCGIAAGQFMARNEGIREMAGRIFEDVQKFTPEQYLTMMGEEISSRQKELRYSSTHTPNNQE